MCRKMARTGDSSDDSDSDGDIAVSRWRRPPPSDDECDDAIVLKSHQLRSSQRDSNIVLNIRNARQIPVLSKEEKKAQAAVLRLNFPVSSGVQHRAREWQPVTTGSATSTTPTVTEADNRPQPEVTRGVNVKNIGQVVTERLNALRRLSANPDDTSAMNAAYEAQQKLQLWAESKRGPGTLPPTVKLRMPKPLLKSTASSTSTDEQQADASSSETAPSALCASAESSTSTTASAVMVSAMLPTCRPPAMTCHTTLSAVHLGRLLLQKMGWKEGEGLGKDNSGPTAPLILDMKKDRKGLAWVDPDLKRRPPRPLIETPAYPDLATMPAVAALYEFCMRRRMLHPAYELIEDYGPAHRKTFRYKVIVDGIEYQPCVASGNKKAARAEAAMICLQELAALPVDHPLPPPTQAAPPHPHAVLGFPTGPSRPPICLPPRPPQPPTPLMSLQPRPQFASLPLHRQPNPAVSAEPPPPGVDVSDFTSNVFDDSLRQFESTLKPVSADQPHEDSEPENAEHGTLDFEASEEQFKEDSFVASGSVGLLGDVPEGLEDDGDEYFDDGNDFGCSDAELNEFPHDFHPPWLDQQAARNMPGFFGENPEHIYPEFSDRPMHIRNMPGIFGENPENIHPEFSDRPSNIAFGQPRFHPPEFEDFSEDTLLNDGSSILGEYYHGSDELFGEEFPPLEEDFQSDICLQNVVGFGRGNMLRGPRPFCARGPRMSQISCSVPRVPQQFSRGPPQQFPRPSFKMPSPLLLTPLARGAFRPRVLPFVRPFPSLH